MPRANPAAAEPPLSVPTRTAFLVVDTESVPDGRLLNAVKYPGLNLTDEEAIDRARDEARLLSSNGSDFLPYTFQIPVAVCVARVGLDFTLQSVKCIDSPYYRVREIVSKFWKGLEFSRDCTLVTFNGRGFDLPLLELAAFRYGCSAPEYFANRRKRFSGDIDLLDHLQNFGAARGFVGGLNLLAKLLGKPGKMEVAGSQVYDLYRQGKIQEINDYCMCDTLDTYFVFLRTRVLTGDITLEREAEIIRQAKDRIAATADEYPALRTYLANWQDWKPWP